MINKEEYQQNGFVVINKVFDLRFLDQLRQRYIYIFAKLINSIYLDDSTLFQLFEDNPAGFKNCGLMVQNMLETYQLMLSPEVMLNVKQLLEDPVVVTKPVPFFSHPKLSQDDYWNTPPHQDLAASQVSDDAIVVWVPLSDITPETGSILVAKESHKQGLMTSRFENNFGVVDGFDDKLEPVEIKKGDMLIFSQKLIHKSDKNTSDQIRWVMTFRFGNLANKEWQVNNYRNDSK